MDTRHGGNGCRGNRYRENRGRINRYKVNKYRINRYRINKYRINRYRKTEAEHADTETDKIRGIYPDAETQYTGGDLSLWHRPAR
ncbi:MAG: hypothetical protein ACLRMW_02455 [[Clostridium] symbiosum]